MHETPPGVQVRVHMPPGTVREPNMWKQVSARPLVAPAPGSQVSTQPSPKPGRLPPIMSPVRLPPSVKVNLRKSSMALQAPSAAATTINEANAKLRIRSSLELHLQAARRRCDPGVRRGRLLLGLDDEQDDAGGQRRGADADEHVGGD